MSNYVFKMPTVFQNANRNMTLVFQLDIPNEGPVNLRHPDLLNIIEGFIKDSYTKIPTMGAGTYHQKLIGSWKVSEREYAETIIRLIQDRSRSTKEVRYTIMYSDGEIAHNLQFINDDAASVALISVPGFHTRVGIYGPERTEESEKTILSLLLDMSTTDKELLESSAKFHASHIDETCKNFFDHSETVYKHMVEAVETYLNNSTDGSKDATREYVPFENMARYSILSAINDASAKIIQDFNPDQNRQHACIILTIKLATVTHHRDRVITTSLGGYKVDVKIRTIDSVTKKVVNTPILVIDSNVDEPDVAVAKETATPELPPAAPSAVTEETSQTT